MTDFKYLYLKHKPNRNRFVQAKKWKRGELILYLMVIAFVLLSFSLAGMIDYEIERGYRKIEQKEQK